MILISGPGTPAHGIGNGPGNSREGCYDKTVTTTAGPVRVPVPRDRNSTSGPQIVAKRQRRLGPLRRGYVPWPDVRDDLRRGPARLPTGRTA